jgi:SagB-type dehydrogenase family enzyme
MQKNTDKMLDYHEETKHSELSVRGSAHYLDWENKPSPFKVYRNLTSFPLPRDIPRPLSPSLPAIRGTSSKNFNAMFDVGVLAEILFFSAGLTRKIALGGVPYYMRAASATGALYPIELYVICGKIPGVEAGVYHFNPFDFSLVRLREGDYRPELAAACCEEENVTWPVTIAMTSMVWRNAWKYEARSYRHWFWDSGVIAANLLATSSSEGLTTRLALGFTDPGVDRLLGLEIGKEATVALAHVGVGLSAKVEGPPKEVAPLAAPAEPLSREEVEYPTISKANEASTFNTRAQVRKWREGYGTREPGVPEGRTNVPLEPVIGESPSPPLEDVILLRGSTLRFARRPIPFEHLSTVIDACTADIPLDFLPPGETLVDLYLIANAVDGLSPGSYFCDVETRSLELLKAGEFRGVSAYLCLEQSLFGDASAVFYLMADLRRVLSSLGSRGYRAAQFEAGVRAGKAYLSSYSLGMGASGSTFYDDAITEFFSPHAKKKSTMIAVGVGVPAYRARTGRILPQMA